MKHLFLAFLTMIVALPAFAADKAKESAFERMVRTGTLHCGYILYDPVVMKDPNTGEMSGIVVDLMNEIARRTGTGMKVEWTVESSYATFAEDIGKSNVDLMCATLWTMTDTGLHGVSTIPLWYSGLGAFVRADDERFQNITALNSETVTISSMDGSISGIVAREDFPKAKLLEVPDMSDYSLQLLNVVNGKADAAFLEVNIAAAFLKSHPGALKNLIPDAPLRIYSNALLVRRGEQDMLNFINMALTEMMNDGFIDKLLSKYEAYPGSFYRVALPYRNLEPQKGSP